jgi:heme-degrading monooxygenase HmoA
MAVVKINAIEIPPGAGEELERRFAARMGAVEGTPGFLGFELLRPVAGETRYFVYTKWDSEEAYQAWAAGPAREAHGRAGAGHPGAAEGGERPKPVATGATLLEFEVVRLADAG